MNSSGLAGRSSPLFLMSLTTPTIVNHGRSATWFDPPSDGAFVAVEMPGESLVHDQRQRSAVTIAGIKQPPVQQLNAQHLESSW
jgi:hypothetical protein